MGHQAGVRRGRWLRWLPLAIPVLLVLVLGWTHRWLTDDGFIYFRIVDQFNAGNGPVFNEGQRVEVYTSPAWVLVLILGDLLLPLPLEWIGVLLGIASAAGGVAFAMAGALRLAGARDREDDDRVFLPAAALVMVAPLGMWIWFSSGLETGLTWLWLGACFFVLSRWADRPGPPSVAACVLLGLGWLVRPELVLISALFVIVLVVGDWRRTTWVDRARTVAAMVAVPVLYQIFRMGYFGLITANTAVAKEGSSFAWGRGWDYLADAVRPYRMWFPVLVVLVAGYVPLALRASNRRRLVVGAYLVGAVACTLYVVAIGGDYLHARMFVPALFLLCAPLAAVPVRRRFAGMALVVPWAVLAMASWRPPVGLLAETFTPPRFGDLRLAERGWTPDRIAALRSPDVAVWVESNPFQSWKAKPATFEASPAFDRPVLVSSGIGTVGYALGPDVDIFDVLGLADPVGSHFEPRAERDGKVGHEKPRPAAWTAAVLVAEGAEVDPGELGPVAVNELAPLIPLVRGPAFQEQVDQARRALACGNLAELEQAATEPLTPARFVDNLLGAPARTRLRIPADPGEAVAAFCD